MPAARPQAPRRSTSSRAAFKTAHPTHRPPAIFHDRTPVSGRCGCFDPASRGPGRSWNSLTRARRLLKSRLKQLLTPQKPAEEPSKLGTLELAPGLTTLARGLQVHARNRPSGLALAQALV